MTDFKPFLPTAAQTAALDLLSGPAREILLYGGSRSGKTFIWLYAIIYRALKAPGSRHAIFRRHFSTAKQSIVFDTFPKVMKLAFPGVAFNINHTDWFVAFPNGSEIWIGGLDDQERADKVLGKEFATIAFNECSEISEDSVNTALTRLAQKTELRNRVYFDCNPPSKRHWIYKRFFGDHQVSGADTESRAQMRMNPVDNRDNIAPGFIEDILERLPAAKRKRFLEGKFEDAVEGALWKQDWIDRDRVYAIPEGVSLARVVAALDPSATSTGDEAGVIVVARGSDAHFYVLDDLSIQGSPEAWARQAVTAYHRHKADRIVYESNQGGEMVALTLKTIDKRIPIQAVHASRGKVTRAEPVAALAEQGTIHHVGVLSALEDELCQWKAGDADSPNRLDAMVWGVTALFDNAEASSDSNAFAGFGVFGSGKPKIRGARRIV